MKNRKRCRRKTQKNRRDQKQFSEDLSTKQCSSSVREYSDPIPVDVLIDIFSRVSATSIARFRCVSKLWESILGRPDFTELFLTKSLARPRLLFIFEANEKLYAFSSPQPQNPHENTTLVATPYKCFPKHTPTSIRTVHCGLVFLRHWGNSKVWMISNPVTDEIITLPEVKVAGNRDSFLGFDPISKQFKVLCMSWSRSNTHRRSKTPNTHWILTLETGKLFWRTVQDPILPHFPSLHVDGVCINGVLYYGAFFFPDNTRKIVCFDFRFEKFSFITLDKDMCPTSPLFNYKGKLGAHQYIGPFHNSKSVLLWVLEDGEKHKWTKHICILPSVVFQNNKFVGMTGTGELVFLPCTCNLSQPFYIFFYNIEKETYTRVHIQGFEEFKKDDFTYVQTSLDFVEDMKFI